MGYGSLDNGKMFDIYLNLSGQIGGHFHGGGFDTLGNDSPIYILNKWQHLVLTYDGTKVYVYYNGDYYKEKQIILDTGISKLFIGKGAWPSPANFYGNISSLKVYDRILTNDEIETLYDQGLGGAGVTIGAN